MTFLRLRLPHTLRPAKAVAADVSILHAAASYIVPYNGLSDPGAKSAFVSVVNSFTNGADLVLPLPGSETERIPVFSRLWDERKAVTTVANLELGEAAYASIESTGVDPFVRFVEGAAKSVAVWIGFIFSRGSWTSWFSMIMLGP